MKLPICELIAKFVAEPEATTDQVRERREELLSHLDTCEVCANALDNADNAERLFEVLAGEELTLTPDERRRVDDLVKADTAREEEIRKAVRDALIPGLGKTAAAVAERYDPLVLYGATEAVSLLIRRHVALNKNEPRVIQLQEDGAVSVDLLPAIPADGVALEIARFTGLWAQTELPEEAGKLSPSPQAKELASWVYKAASHQRRLLRHFRVPRLSLLRLTKGLPLVPLTPEERIDEPYKRWRPDFVQAAQKLFIAIDESRPGSPQPVSIFAVSVPTFERCTAGLQQHVTPSDQSRRTIAFVGSSAFVNRPLTERAVAAGRQELLLPDGVRCIAEFVGTFDGVSFEEDGVKLLGDQHLMIRAAERVILPWDVTRP
jgi:hypothetical protein